MTFNKYSDSKVYKIISTDSNNKFVYYGSTTLSLTSRFNMHKASFTHWLKDETKNQAATYPYFKQYGIENFKIELIAKIDCKTHKELLTLERYHTDNNECINKNKPIRSVEEMKEIKRLISKEYYKNNREHHISVVKKRYHEKKIIIDNLEPDNVIS
jgi:hypothetical protein